MCISLKTYLINQFYSNGWSWVRRVDERKTDNGIIQIIKNNFESSKFRFQMISLFAGLVYYINFNHPFKWYCALSTTLLDAFLQLEMTINCILWLHDSFYYYGFILFASFEFFFCAPHKNNVRCQSFIFLWRK